MFVEHVGSFNKSYELLLIIKFKKMLVHLISMVH